MKKNNNINQLIVSLSQLNRERTDHIFSLVHGKPMIHGLPHDVFRRCGKINCRCNEGGLHGPYPALSVNKNGRQKIVMIKKPDIAITLKAAKRYSYFQKRLAQIRKINKDIDAILEQIKELTIKTYPSVL